MRKSNWHISFESSKIWSIADATFCIFSRDCRRLFCSFFGDFKSILMMWTGTNVQIRYRGSIQKSLKPLRINWGPKTLSFIPDIEVQGKEPGQRDSLVDINSLHLPTPLPFQEYILLTLKGKCRIIYRTPFNAENLLCHWVSRTLQRRKTETCQEFK